MVILIFLMVLGFAEAKQGPSEKPRATPLSTDHLFFEKHSAPGFWPLIAHYQGQKGPTSCGLVSLTMVLNAAKALRKTAEDQNSTEEGLRRLFPSIEQGISLKALGDQVKNAFHGLSSVQVATVYVGDLQKKVRDQVIDSLTKLSPRVWMIANFDQGQFTNDVHVGHFAPVGAYDAENQKVLILDPDRAWYEPYWVALETFLVGMNTQDSTEKTHRGYLLIQAE